jgi:hypothetical protein
MPYIYKTSYTSAQIEIPSFLLPRILSQNIIHIKTHEVICQTPLKLKLKTPADVIPVSRHV